MGTGRLIGRDGLLLVALLCVPLLGRLLRRHDALLDSFVPATFVGNHDVDRIASTVGPDKAVLAAAEKAELAILETAFGARPAKARRSARPAATCAAPAAVTCGSSSRPATCVRRASSRAAAAAGSCA